MKAFIDAPLLIYLNTLSEPVKRALYENFYMNVLTQYKVYTDVLVLDEVIYVSKKRYGIPYSTTIEFIQSTVIPFITILELGEEEYHKAAEIMREYNIKPSDALHLGAAMDNNNISLIISEDREYDKIPSIKRLWVTTL